MPFQKTSKSDIGVESCNPTLHHLGASQCYHQQGIAVGDGTEQKLDRSLFSPAHNPMCVVAPSPDASGEGLVVRVGVQFRSLSIASYPDLSSLPPVLIREFETAFGRSAVQSFHLCPLLNDLPSQFEDNSKRWLAAFRVRSVPGALRASLRCKMAVARPSSRAVIFHNPTRLGHGRSGHENEFNSGSIYGLSSCKLVASHL